nr:hypothetical protein [uncultured Dyadobacter sp.]
MSKRLIRIKSAELPTAISRLQKFSINAVLSDGNTLFGKVISFSGDHFTLKDTRDHAHLVRFGDVYEIVYDTIQN